MTDIVQMSKNGTNFYPQTHAQAVLGLPDFSSFQKASDVQTAITNAIKGIPQTNLTNYPTKSEMTTAITNAKPDLSGFVNMTQVQSAITKATEGLPHDLTNYLTKSETLSEITSAVNSAIAKAKPDLSNYPTSAQVQTAITNALGKVDTSQTMNDSTRTKLQNMNKEMGS